MDYNCVMLWCYIIANFNIQQLYHNLEIEMEVSLQVMRCDRLLICDTMIAVHYGHLSHLLQTRGLGAVLVSACQHGSRGHMQLGGI